MSSVKNLNMKPLKHGKNCQDCSPISLSEIPSPHSFGLRPLCAVFLGAAWQSDVAGPDPGGQTLRRPQGGVEAGRPHLALRQGWGNVTFVLIGHGVIDFSLQNFGIDLVHDEIHFAQ